MSSPILDPAPYQTISTVRAELNLWFPHYPCARGGVEVGEDMGTDDDIPKYAEMCAAFPFCRRQTEGPAHLNGGGGNECPPNTVWGARRLCQVAAGEPRRCTYMIHLPRCQIPWAGCARPHPN